MDAPTPESGNAPRQIAGLDILRFLAALLVMFHHLGWRVWADDYAVPMSYHFFERFAKAGFVGVEVFFVLSGFVIAYSAQRSTARSFLVSRMVRLLPAACICSTLTMLIVFATGHWNMPLGGVPFSAGIFRRWLHSLVLYPLGPWVDGSYWTLGIEIGFYLQILLLLYFGLFRRVGVWMTIVGVMSTACLSVVAYVSAGWKHAAQLEPFANRVNGHPSFLFLLLHHGCLFTIGVMLWLCFFDRVTRGRTSVLLLMLAGVVLDVKLRVEWTGHWHLPLMYWCVAMVGMVFSIAYNREIHALLGTQGAAVARRLGVVTYPLYLLHQVIGYVLIATMKPYLPDLVNLCLTVATVIVLAFAVNVLLEEPVQRWLRRLLGGARLQKIAPAATVP